VGFNINGWLSNLPNSQFVTLNCFDQAGLVHSVLNLGLPHKITDHKGKEYTTVSRWWKGNLDDNKPWFGYIQELDLIGWGLSTNPFFEGDPNI
jgi:hypothetical protein